jgi:hypothetical protein
MTIARLTSAHSLVLVVDVQAKLLPAIPRQHELLRDLTFLLDVAGVLSVPALATEQYPHGLGPTVPTIAERCRPDRPDKFTFSCCAGIDMLGQCRDLGCTQVVLTGLETHVCVLQTGLDLLTAGLTVFVPTDAVAARGLLDHEVALRRLERAGAMLTTVETTAFEWLGSAQHPHFKAVSQLVRKRFSPTPPRATPCL